MLRYWEQLDLLKELVNNFITNNIGLASKYELIINRGNIDVLVFSKKKSCDTKLADKIIEFDLDLCDNLDLCMLKIMVHYIPGIINNPYSFIKKVNYNYD